MARKGTAESSEGQELELQGFMAGSFSECLCIFCGPEAFGIY